MCDFEFSPLNLHPDVMVFFSTWYKTSGGMHNEGVPLRSKVILILVAGQCYWVRKFMGFLLLLRN